MLAAFLFCGTSASAQAQYYETENEISVSIGTASNSEILGAISDFSSVLASALVTGIITGGQYVGYADYSDKSYTTPIAVGYYRHLSKLIAVGGYAAYNGVKRDIYAKWQDSNNNTTTEKIGKARRNNFSLMPSVKFHWVRTKNFGFYSKLGVGATLSHESQEGDSKYTNSQVFFNFDITPIGLDAGSQAFRGFLEFGMGEQGVLCAGLRYKF